MNTQTSNNSIEQLRNDIYRKIGTGQSGTSSRESNWTRATKLQTISEREITSSWSDDNEEQPEYMVPTEEYQTIDPIVQRSIIEESKTKISRHDGGRLRSIARRLDKTSQRDRASLLAIRKHLVESLTLVEKELQQLDVEERPWWRRVLCTNK